MYPGEVPDYFMCPIGMEVMRDPVTTPKGASHVAKRLFRVWMLADDLANCLSYSRYERIGL